MTHPPPPPTGPAVTKPGNRSGGATSGNDVASLPGRAAVEVRIALKATVRTAGHPGVFHHASTRCTQLRLWLSDVPLNSGITVWRQSACLVFIPGRFRGRVFFSTPCRAGNGSRGPLCRYRRCIMNMGSPVLGCTTPGNWPGTSNTAPAVAPCRCGTPTSSRDTGAAGWHSC